MRDRISSKRWRTTALLALGVAVGVMLVAPPAGAHFLPSISHIWSHIKPKADVRYANAVAGTDKAKNADKLDGLDSTTIALTRQDYVQGNLALSTSMASPTTITSLTLPGPANYLVTGAGMVFLEAGTGEIGVDLARDGSELGGWFNEIGLPNAGFSANYAITRLVNIPGSSGVVSIRGFRFGGTGTPWAFVNSLTATRVGSAVGAQRAVSRARAGGVVGTR